MKTCLALRHIAHEDLAGFGPVLEKEGFAIRYLDVAKTDLAAVDPLADDLWVVLGGPFGVYEEDRYPFLTPEIALIAKRLQADRPTAGICLGAQLMARALGAKVYPNPKGREVGWSRVDLTEAGRKSVLAPLTETEVLHWHGDTFDLPDGAVHLASTDKAAQQAFTWGKGALALQFHLEVTAPGLERWMTKSGLAYARSAGTEETQLRSDTARYASRVEERGGEVLLQWLRASAK